MMKMEIDRERTIHQQNAHEASVVVSYFNEKLKELDGEFDDNAKIVRAVLTHYRDECTKVYQAEQAAAWGYSKQGR